MEYADDFSFPLFVGGIGRGVRKAVPCNGLKKHLFLEKKSTSGLAVAVKICLSEKMFWDNFCRTLANLGMV